MSFVNFLIAKSLKLVGSHGMVQRKSKYGTAVIAVNRNPSVDFTLANAGYKPSGNKALDAFYSDMVHWFMYSPVCIQEVHRISDKAIVIDLINDKGQRIRFTYKDTGELTSGIIVTDKEPTTYMASTEFIANLYRVLIKPYGIPSAIKD